MSLHSRPSLGVLGRVSLNAAEEQSSRVSLNAADSIADLPAEDFRMSRKSAGKNRGSNPLLGSLLDEEGGGGQENGNAQPPQFVCVDGVPGDGSMKDWDGALAQELEACERSGDPANEGVIWPRYESLMRKMLDLFWSRGDWRPFLPDLFFYLSIMRLSLITLLFFIFRS
mgnify:CR=1 FL=1